MCALSLLTFYAILHFRRFFPACGRLRKEDHMDPNNKNNKQNKNSKNKNWMGVLKLIAWAVVLTVVFNYIGAYSHNTANKTSSHEVEYSQFIAMVNADQVKDVVFEDDTLYITPVDEYTYHDEDTDKDFPGKEVTLYTTEIKGGTPALLALLDEHPDITYTSPYQAIMNSRMGDILA